MQHPVQAEGLVFGFRPTKAGFFATRHRPSRKRTVRLSTSNPISPPEKEKPNYRLSLALASTYFSVMGAKCALPAVMVLLRGGLSYTADPFRSMSRMLTTSTLAIAAGKLLSGPVIDVVGGIRSLQVTLSLLAVLMATIGGYCTTFGQFALCWIAVDFLFSSCWASCIHAIHQGFPKEKWPTQIGTLAAAARTGNAAFFAIFAAMLQRDLSWRSIFLVASGLQIVPLVLLSTVQSNSMLKQQTLQKPNTVADSVRVAKEEAQKPAFWLHFISRSALMITASFLLFVPNVMTSIYGASPAVASQTASLYALGCLASVTLASPWFARTKRKVLALSILLGGSLLSSLGHLGHILSWWNISSLGGALLFLVWGLAFAIPFYIPPSLYALSRGAQSGTIADMFDMGGFLLLAKFNGYVANIPVEGMWSMWATTFTMTSLCALVSYAALVAVHLRKDNGTNMH